MSVICTAAIILAVTVLGIPGAQYTALDVHYSFIFGGYWSMPKTVSEVKSESPQRFVLVDHDDELNVDVYSYQDDPRFFLLFDTYGNIAGIRTGYIKDDIERVAQAKNLNFEYLYSAIPMFNSIRYWNTLVWSANVLFASPEVLKAGGRQDTQGEVAEGVYVFLDNEWKRIPENECDITDLGFTKQACFFGMGQHYFYKITPESNCETLQPFFALYDNHKLHGFGLTPFGSSTASPDGHVWFETFPWKAAAVTTQIIKSIVPNGPQCLYDWTNDYQISSLHVFLKPRARFTMCPLRGDDSCE